MDSTPRIAVVIPYFQRRAGLLRRALESVASQLYLPAQVIVVDDGSPVPPTLELDEELTQRLPNFTLVRQENQGISGARNTALASVRSDMDAVAFLDSDDTWDAPHLEYAARALSEGADLYFANFTVPGETANAFLHDPGRHHLLTPSLIAHWTQGVPELMRSACPLMTSVIVYRRALHPTLRFSDKFRRAGEDHVAWWELALRARSIMYCTEPTATYQNDGIGTWQHAVRGTREHLSRLVDEIRLQHYLMRSVPVRPSDLPRIRQRIATLRFVALSSALHLARRHHRIAAEILRLMWVDPGCASAWAMTLPPLLLKWRASRTE
jgi:succinoglycan biosynthesis protein ExoW